jgi:hypothetical protein
MAEQNQNSVQQIFFSKETISVLNKNLLQDGTLQNLSRDGKQEVINMLVKNMKNVYKNLDSSKINKTNFTSIFDQFKKISVSHTIADIKKQNIVGTYQQSPADLKFQRDFTSNPNKGNQLMDRPEPTKQMDPKTANHQIHNVEQKRNQQKQQMDPFSGFSSDMGSYDSNLDAAFRPIVDSLTDQDAFNSYDTGRNMDDVKTRMNSIQQARETELSQRNARPSTPDFLKSKKTNIRPDNNDDSSNKGHIPSDQERRNGPGQVPDFKNVNPSQFNNGFNGLANDTGDNLFSLDNIDRPLIECDIVEDTASFEDRLKRLQSDRDVYSQPNPNKDVQPKDIDFTSSNFPVSNMGDNSINYNNNSREHNSNEQQVRQAENQRYQQMKQSDNQRQQIEQRQQADSQRQQIEQRQQADSQRQQIEQRKQAELQRQKTELQKQQYTQSQQSINANVNKIDDLRSSMRSMNIDVKEDSSKINQFKQTIEKLEYDNLQLKTTVERLEDELNKPSEIDKINQIKEQIALEFETLNNKNEELETKQSHINLKEIELNKKEIDVKQLIANYDYLFKSQHLQLEVSNKENKSSYVWSMEPIKNVIGIKLMSYSLPLPRFNIEQNKNDVFTYNFNTTEYSIVIPTGKYTIDELVLVLNEKNKINCDNLKFSVNNEQRIIFESTNEEDKIEINQTVLSKENLGFLFTTSAKAYHISDRIWDLRIEDKIYLYLNNLSDEVPFGILYFNGQSVSQFKFQDPFDLNNLEIVFKDSRGMPYDFYGLSHSLSFLIEKIN